MPASRANAIEWFRNANDGGPNRKLQANIRRGEAGDVLFMGDPCEMADHSVLVGSVTVNDDGSVTIVNIGQFGEVDGDDWPVVGERAFTARQNENGDWVFDNGMIFRGYGQIIQPITGARDSDDEHGIQRDEYGMFTAER